MGKPDDLFSTRQVSRQLGIKPWRLQYLLDCEEVPEPTYIVANRRVFTAEDVGAIQKVLKENPHLCQRKRQKGGAAIEP